MAVKYYIKFISIYFVILIIIKGGNKMRKKLVLLFVAFFVLFTCATSQVFAAKVDQLSKQQFQAPAPQSVLSAKETVTLPYLEGLAFMFNALGPMFFSFDNNIMSGTVIGPMGLYVLPRFNALVRAIVDPIQKYYVGRSLPDLIATQIGKELNAHPDAYAIIDDRAVFEFAGFRADFKNIYNAPLDSVEKVLRTTIAPNGDSLLGKRLFVMCA